MNDATPSPYRTSLTRVIGEGSFYNLLDIVSGKFLSFATVVILLRYLGVFDYGIWILAKSFYDAGANFIAAGAGPTLLADLNIERSRGNLPRFKSILVDFFVLRAVAAFLAFVIFFFGAVFLSAFSANAILPVLRLFSFLFLLFPFKSLMTLFFKAHLRFDIGAYWSMLENTLFLVSVFLFVYLLQMGVYGVVYALIAATGGALVCFTPLFLADVRFLRGVPRAPENAVWAIFRGHGKWAVLTTGVGSINKNILSWASAYLLGVNAVAILSVATSLIGHLASLMPISAVLTPIFPLEIDNPSRIRELLFRGFKYSLYAGVAFAVVSGVLMHLFIATFFPHYLPSVPLFYLMLPMLFISPLSSLLAPILNALRRQKDLFFIQLSRSVLAVVVTVVLIYAFGIRGAAASAVAVSFIITLGRYRALIRVLPRLTLDFTQLFVLDSLDKILFTKALERTRALVNRRNP